MNTIGLVMRTNEDIILIIETWGIKGKGGEPAEKNKGFRRIMIKYSLKQSG